MVLPSEFFVVTCAINQSCWLYVPNSGVCIMKGPLDKSAWIMLLVLLARIFNPLYSFVTVIGGPSI